jgi:hypothetical protein
MQYAATEKTESQISEVSFSLRLKFRDSLSRGSRAYQHGFMDLSNAYSGSELSP